jgi:DNA-directed RNA polymerase specialized sigma24 family protein
MKTPTEHLAEAIEQPDFYASLKRWARLRARKLGRTWDADRYAEDLVQEAIADVLSGTLSWDPERIPLIHHLRRAIRSQSRHHFAHVMRFRTEAFDEADVVEEEHETARVIQRAHQVAAALRSLATDDLEVLLILDALEHDEEPSEVVPDPHRYSAARVRMKRLAKSLPARLGPHCRKVISKKRQRPDGKRREIKTRRP